MDFYSLKRRDLQALCKLNNIPANMTNIAMADALKSLQFVEGLEEFSKQPKCEDPESPEKSEITTPGVPRTSTCRRTRRGEQGSANLNTRTRYGTRSRAAQAASVKPKIASCFKNKDLQKEFEDGLEKSEVSDGVSECSSVLNEMPKIKGNANGEDHVQEKPDTDRGDSKTKEDDCMSEMQESCDAGEVEQTEIQGANVEDSDHSVANVTMKVENAVDFHSLTRKELQALCKRNKIPANMTNAAMTDALKSLEIVEGLEEILKQCESEATESPEKSMISTPCVPRTLTSRKTTKKEPRSTKLTTTRHQGTRRRIAEEMDQGKTDAPEPPPASSGKFENSLENCEVEGDVSGNKAAIGFESVSRSDELSTGLDCSGVNLPQNVGLESRNDVEFLDDKSENSHSAGDLEVDLNQTVREPHIEELHHNRQEADEKTEMNLEEHEGGEEEHKFSESKTSQFAADNSPAKQQADPNLVDESKKLQADPNVLDGSNFNEGDAMKENDGFDELDDIYPLGDAPVDDFEDRNRKDHGAGDFSVTLYDFNAVNMNQMEVNAMDANIFESMSAPETDFVNNDDLGMHQAKSVIIASANFPPRRHQKTNEEEGEAAINPPSTEETDHQKTTDEEGEVTLNPPSAEETFGQKENEEGETTVNSPLAEEIDHWKNNEEEAAATFDLPSSEEEINQGQKCVQGTLNPPSAEETFRQKDNEEGERTVNPPLAEEIDHWKNNEEEAEVTFDLPSSEEETNQGQKWVQGTPTSANTKSKSMMAGSSIRKSEIPAKIIDDGGPQNVHKSCGSTTILVKRLAQLSLDDSERLEESLKKSEVPIEPALNGSFESDNVLIKQDREPLFALELNDLPKDQVPDVSESAALLHSVSLLVDNEVIPEDSISGEVEVENAALRTVEEVVAEELDSVRGCCNLQMTPVSCKYQQSIDVESKVKSKPRTSSMKKVTSAKRMMNDNKENLEENAIKAADAGGGSSNVVAGSGMKKLSNRELVKRIKEAAQKLAEKKEKKKQVLQSRPENCLITQNP